MGNDKYNPRKTRTFYYLNKDLHDAESLYEYVKYGLYIRGCLEVKGPYSIGINFEHNYIESEEKYKSRIRLDKFKDADEFNKHESRVMNYARAQLISTHFVILEYFLSNLYDDLAKLLARDNGLVASDLYLDFSAENRAALKRLKSMEEYLFNNDAWRRKTHHWDEIKNRIRDISSFLQFKHDEFKGSTVFGSSHSDYTVKEYSWAEFCNIRDIRHGIAHASARSSMFSSHVIDGNAGDFNKSLLIASSWITSFAFMVNKKMYELPILIDKRAGSGMGYQYVDKVQEPMDIFSDS